MSPVGRPVALSQPRGLACSGPGSAPISAANDSPPARPLRISAARLDRIAADLSATDRAVLEFVSQARLCSGAQLERRYWPDGESGSRARQARRALSRLADWRVLDRLARQVGGRRAGSRGFIYAVGPVGARLLARTGSHTRQLGAPGDRYVTHTLALTELVVRLHEAHRHGDLDLIEVQPEPVCWRPFIGSMGARLVLKPDLFVRLGVGALEDRWMIEVDLATEASGTLLAKAGRYLAHYRSGAEQQAYGVYPRVVWLVPNERRAEQVTAALSRLPAEAWRLFAVWQFDEVVARLAAEAAS